MSRLVDNGTIRAMSKGSYRPIVLVEIVTPSLNIRLVSNSQDVVYNGNTYTAGLLGGISEITESTDLNNAQISLIVSGVEPSIKAAVVAPDFINSKITVRVQFFDENWKTPGDGLIYFVGSAASQNIASSANSEITISCKNRIATLSRPRSERYSDQEQQAQHPGDLGMQYATELASRQIIWPARQWFKDNE